MNHSPPGSSVHGILQARILEWVAMPSSRGSSWARNWTSVSCITGRFFTHWATWEIHAKSTNPRLNMCSSDTLLPFFVHVTFPLFHTSSLTPIQLLYLTRFLRTCLTWFFSFPGGSVGKEPACNAGDLGLIPGLGRSPGGRHSNLENLHGQRSLVGYSLWDHNELDMTEWLSTLTFIEIFLDMRYGLSPLQILFNPHNWSMREALWSSLFFTMETEFKQFIQRHTADE